MRWLRNRWRRQLAKENHRRRERGEPVASGLRRCRWCRLILDQNAPPHGDAVESNVGGLKARRVQPHCDSRLCDWCWICFHRRLSMMEAGLDPDTGDPAKPADPGTTELPGSA